MRYSPYKIQATRLKRDVCFIVGLATFFSVLCGFFLFGIRAEQGYRTGIAQSRGPSYTTDESQATLAYRVDETNFNGKKVGVLYLDPRSEDAPPPPGLSSWPLPGEVAISANLLEEREYIERQFGPISGTVDESLVLTGDYLVYIRPHDSQTFWERAAQERGVYLSPGFLGEEGALFGIVTHEEQAKLLFPTALIMLVFPLSFFLLYTRRRVREELANEQFLLECIGARRIHLISSTFRAVALPIAVGAFLALLSEVLVIICEPHVPLTDFPLHRQAFLERIGLLVCVNLIAFALLLLTFLTPATRQTHARRNFLPQDTAGVVSFLTGVILASIISFVGIKMPDFLVVPTLLLAIVLILIGYQAVSAHTVRLYARIREKGAGDEFSRTKYTWITESPHYATRFAALTGVFIIIGVMIVAIFSRYMERFTFGYIPQNTTIVETRFRCAETPQCVTDFLESVREVSPESTLLVQNLSTAQYFIYGNKENLAPGARDYINYIERDRGEIPIRVPNSDDSHLIIHTITPGNVSPLHKIQALRTNDPLLPLSQNYDEGERAGIFEAQSLWLVLITYIAFLISIPIIVQGARNTSEREALELAEPVALTGQAKKAARYISLRTLEVNLVSGTLAILVGIYLATTTMFGRPEFFPQEFILVMIATIILLSLYQATVAYRSVKKAAASWLPGKAIS